jgi:antitoxin (DNA-binding transcriptional repressor) of toxin-antitoxin stability system
MPFDIADVATRRYISSMISTGIRDLKNNLSRYIRRLKVEKRIVVTDRGAAVAELRLPEESRGDPVAGHYAVLVASGVIRPAIHRGDPLADWPSSEELSLPAGTVTKLIDEDRGDR